MKDETKRCAKICVGGMKCTCNPQPGTKELARWRRRVKRRLRQKDAKEFRNFLTGG